MRTEGFTPKKYERAEKKLISFLKEFDNENYEGECNVREFGDVISISILIKNRKGRKK